MSVKIGDTLVLNHHVALVRNFTAHAQHLDVWPPLPIVLSCGIHKIWDKTPIGRHLGGNKAAIPGTNTSVPLPGDETVPIIPDSFLSGFAPRLRAIYLHYISFPGLPKLLLSATHLVTLSLEGYFSPEALAVGLSSLIRLKMLQLEFQSPQSRPDQERPLSRRPQLPVLTLFKYMGVRTGRFTGKWRKARIGNVM